MQTEATDLVIDGVTYITVKKAAALAEYTADYVGQLCRGGKLEATRVGRAWYVSEGSIIEHKESQVLKAAPLPRDASDPKDEQEERIVRPSRISPKTIFKESAFIVYRKDDSPLLPKLKSAVTEEPVQKKEEVEAPVTITEPQAEQNTTQVRPRAESKAFISLLNLFQNIGSGLLRGIIGAASFAIVFLLIFSFNGTYTGGLIGSVVKESVARAGATEVGMTVNNDLLSPYRYAASELNTRVNDYVYELVYAEAIYEHTRAR